MAKYIKRHPIPYHAALDTKLLKFGRGDYFTIGDACEGVQIFGGTGSGKSSGSGRALALAYLRAGFGGLVCCSKVEEAQIWRGLAKETKRDNHLFIIDEKASLRFNFMDYAQATIARDGFDRNLVDMLITVSESANTGAGGAGEGNEFFKDQAINMLTAAFAPLREFEGSIQLPQVYRFIISAPNSEKQLDDPKWQSSSYFYKVFTNLAMAAKAGNMACKQVCEDYGEYWYNEFPSLGDKTRSSIVATVGNTIKPFLTGAFRDLWCTGTDIVPEVCREGAIIVLDIPVRKYGKMAAVAQQLFKMNWQIAMENSGGGEDVRPCFLFCDESQFVMNAGDAQHLSVARSAKSCSVYITQDKPSYFAAITGANSEAVTDSLISKFQTRIFHANSDPITNSYAADICGKITQFHTTSTQSTSHNSGGAGTVTDDANNSSGSGGQGVSAGKSLNTYKDYVFPPDSFSDQLRTGTKANKYQVDAIIVRNGRNFKSTGKHYLKAAFSQR